MKYFIIHLDQAPTGCADLVIGTVDKESLIDDYIEQKGLHEQDCSFIQGGQLLSNRSSTWISPADDDIADNETFGIEPGQVYTSTTGRSACVLKVRQLLNLGSECQVDFRYDGDTSQTESISRFMEIFPHSGMDCYQSDDQSDDQSPESATDQETPDMQNCVCGTAAFKKSLTDLSDRGLSIGGFIVVDPEREQLQYICYRDGLVEHISQFYDGVEIYGTEIGKGGMRAMGGLRAIKKNKKVEEKSEDIVIGEIEPERYKMGQRDTVPFWHRDMSIDTIYQWAKSFFPKTGSPGP